MADCPCSAETLTAWVVVRFSRERAPPRLRLSRVTGGRYLN